MKTISINPHNQRMEIFARCVNVINEFKKLGFENRSAFVEVIQEYDESYKEYAKTKQLHDFWIIRALKMDILTDMETILEQLKQE